MNIDISVIIPVYNAEDLIQRTLASVLGQQTKYELEIICVDDGSTDKSVEIIECLTDDRIRLFRQSNSGPSVARNKGIQEAQGRYIAFLDADDFWEDSFIERTVAFLDEHDDCVAVSVGQRHLTVSGETTSPLCMVDYPAPIVLPDFYQFWAENNHVCTGSVTMRTDVARHSGGMRQDLRCNEDWEFWALVGSYGKWGFIPKVLFTSDGIDVSRSVGWIQKMEPRWKNARSVDFWEQRLKEKAPQLADNEGYRRKVGIIASNIAYSLLLSGREAQARDEVRKYGRYFENNKMNRLFLMCARNQIIWRIMCGLLRYREYHRNI